MSNVAVQGWFDVECFNPDGSLAWRERVKNGATTPGLNALLNVGFGAGTQLTTWYLGLISNVGFSVLAPGDTMSSHSGWNESQDYSESNRPTWTPGSASGGAITNPSSVSFTINTTGVQLYGLFLCSDNTKGGTAGTLWATGAFSQVQRPTNGQVLKVTYTSALTAQ